MNACTISIFVSTDAWIVHITDNTVVIVRIPSFLRGNGEFKQCV